MSVYRRKSGRWAVLVDLDRGADGHRRRRALGTYRTRKEAEGAERKGLEARERGVDLAPQSTTLAEVAARYLADVGTRREHRTVENYEDLLARHILPRLGSVPVAKLQPAHGAELLASLAAGSTEAKPLSRASLRAVHGQLSRVLAWAEKMQIVERNVMRFVDPPKPEPAEASALAPDEVAAVLEAARGDRLFPLFVVAFATGARRGELLALTWADVDFGAASVTIRRAIAQSRKIGLYLKPTKTRNVRVVGLSALALGALHAVRATQAAEKLAAGSAYADGGSVFADALGGWIVPNWATYVYAKFARQAGISSTRLHAARHTAATLMLAAGTDARSVGGVLGHANPSLTLNTYGHLVAGRATAAVEALGAELEAARTRRSARGT